jgi:hypothetical protein
MWQFSGDLSEKRLEVTPIREAANHLNALYFLEPPALLNLTIENLEFNGNLVDADIGIRHPMLGFPEFTGFDVCGIVITGGSNAGFIDPALVMPGEGDTRLLNPDGYSRWWNPTEFPVNNGTWESYIDGMLGTPDSVADYNATLNPYKYYTDSLGPVDDINALDTDQRGMFSAGQKNVRHYSLEIGDAGLVFNYAVDASWEFPISTPPWAPPGSFGPGANRPEAYRIEFTEIENTLGYADGKGGGHLVATITVYDWFDAGLSKVMVESFDGIPGATTDEPIETGEGYAIYELYFPGDNLTQAGDLELLITVASEATGYQDILPGEPVSVYFTRTTTVCNEVIVDCPTEVHHTFYGQGEFGVFGNFTIPPMDAAIISSGDRIGGFIMFGNGFAGSMMGTYPIDDLGPHEPDGFVGLVGYGAPISLDVSPLFDHVMLVMPFYGNNEYIRVWNHNGAKVHDIFSPNGGGIVCADVTHHGEIWFVEQVGNTFYLHHAIPELDMSWSVVSGDSVQILGNMPYVPKIFDLVFVPANERIFLYHALDDGTITVYDTSLPGPPQEDVSLSKSDIWGDKGPLNYYDGGFFCAGADIEIDLVDMQYSACRIVVLANFMSGESALMKLDSELNVLDTKSITGGPYLTFAISVAEEAEDRRIVLLRMAEFKDDYYLFDAPAGW